MSYNPGSFPTLQNHVMPHRFGVPKFGREPPSMWGNPFYPVQAVKPTSHTPPPVAPIAQGRKLISKLSTDPSMSLDMLTRKRTRSNGMLVHTVLCDVATLHKDVDSNNACSMALVRIQACRSESERMKFVERYEQSFPAELDRIVPEIALTGSEYLRQSLISSQADILVSSLQRAVERGIGTIDLSLIEITFLSSRKQLQQILKEYLANSPTGSSLQDDIKQNVTAANFQKLCLAIIESEKKEDTDEDNMKASLDAKELIEAPKNERADKIIQILTTNSFSQIHCFMQEFNQEHKNLREFISKEIPKENRFSDSFTTAITQMFSLVENRVKERADRLIRALTVLKNYLPNANPGLNVIRSMQLINRLFLTEQQDMSRVCTEVYEKQGSSLRTLLSESIQEKLYHNMLLFIANDRQW